MKPSTAFVAAGLGGDRARADAVDAVDANMRPLRPDDIAEAVYWVLSRPAHVNVNVVELTPVAHSFAPFQVHRA